jgi:micrococcal nuclease
MFSEKKFASMTAVYFGGQKRNLNLRMMRSVPFLFFLFFSLSHSSCQESPNKFPHEIQLQVFRIADGDSFEGRSNGENFRIRLYGIDAPERGQDFYRKSKDLLGQLCAEGPVLVRLRSKDGFGRWVADAYSASGKNINYLMVEEGLAWHFTKYSNDPNLASLEKKARTREIGLWSIADPTPPWLYRKQRRQ